MKMQVTKDKFPGLRGDVYRVDGAPVAGRASDEHDDHWYVHVNGLGIYAYVPTADGSDYEEIVIDESHDFAERWDRIVKNPLRLAEIVKHDVDATLIDRTLDAGTMKLYFHGVDGNGDGFLPDTIGSDGHVGASVFQEARRTAKEAVGAGSGDEDWSGWRIEVTTEPNGRGVNVAQFGFEELGAWSPKPEVDVSDEGFLTLGKLIETGEFDGLDGTFTNAEAAFANAEAAFAEAEATLDRVNEQLAEFKWLNKTKSLPSIIETTMTRDLGENMAPFAKSLGEIAGLACRQFPNDDEAVIRYLADGLVHKVGFDRNVAVAVLEGVVKVGDFDADPATIMATIPTKDEIAAMERKAVETSGISR